MYNLPKNGYTQDEYLHEDMTTLLCDTSLKYNKVRPLYSDGTQAECKSIFGINHSYNLREGLPISTIRKINFNAAIDELLWIWQKKSNNVMDLRSRIWDDWATTNNKGELTIGKSYGYQLAKEVFKNPLPEVFGDREKINRVEMLFYKLIFNPSDRRMIVNMYDDNDLDEMNLPPCAFMTMFNVQGNSLNMTLVQRSGDFLVAAHPRGWNCTKYATLLLIIAHCTGYIANTFNHYVNDLHLYNRHEDILKKLYRSSLERDINKSSNYNQNIFMIHQTDNDVHEKNERLIKALEMFNSLTVEKPNIDNETMKIIAKDNSIVLYNYEYQNNIKNIEIAI